MLMSKKRIGWPIALPARLNHNSSVPAHAVANGNFWGCINRVGTEAPWNHGKFYGNSYFVNPLGEIIACGSEDKDELIVAEFDLDLIEQVRSKWQFFRDRRPETYKEIVQP